MPNSSPIPAHAKRVFQGVIYDVWHWEQKMFDGTTQTFEHLSRPDSTQILAVHGNKILLQSQQQPHRLEPFISLPGGRVEKGEDPLESAKRELLEECGYVSDDWELWSSTQPVKTMVYAVHTYIARDCRFHEDPRMDAGERIQNALIDFDSLLALADNPSFRNQVLVTPLLRATYIPDERANLRMRLFGAAAK